MTPVVLLNILFVILIVVLFRGVDRIVDALEHRQITDEMVGWINTVLSTQHKPYDDMQVAHLMDKGHRIIQHFERQNGR